MMGFLMSYGRMLALSVPTALAMIAGASYAAGQIPSESDILGIKLTMTRDQAKKIILDSFPSARIVELPVQIGTPDYKKSLIAGFAADITTAQDQASNQRQAQQANSEFQARKAAGFGNSPLNQTIARPGDYGHDRAVVLYDPADGANGIFAISRVKQFAKSEFIPPKALLDTFIQKYGEPSRVNGNSITWTAPGILQRTQKSFAKCYLDYSEYLYEQVDQDIFNDRVSFLIRNNLNAQFVNVLNNIITNRFSDRSQCGTVMQLFLTTSNDRAYATGINETLIDLTRGYAELRAFADDFRAHADAAKQDQMLKASRNKPKL